MKVYSIQFLYNFALSSASIFTPIYAHQLGASDFTIGLIGMVYGLSIFISGLYFGRQADNEGRRRYIIVGLWLGAALACLQIFATTPELLLAARFLLGFAAGMFPAAVVAYAFDQGKLMGRFAGIGSLGFGLGQLFISFAAAATFLYGGLALPGRVYWSGALILAIACLIGCRLEHIQRPAVHVPSFPKEVIMRNRDVYLSFLVRHTGANAVWIIFPLFVLALSPKAPDGGNDYTWLGIIYGANTLSQVVIMQFLDKYDGRQLVVAGEGLTLVTFVGFYFSQNHIHLLLFSFVLAASWSCLYVGSLKTILSRSPEKATASGLLTSTSSLSAIIGPLVGGTIAQAFGGHRATILFAALMSAAGLVLFKYLTARVDRQYGPVGAGPSG